MLGQTSQPWPSCAGESAAKPAGRVFVDGNFFTDRSTSNILQPSEFDLVMGLALRYQNIEIALIHERDMSLDREGLVQRYTALQLRYEFEWTKSSSPARIAQGGHHAIR